MRSGQAFAGGAAAGIEFVAGEQVSEICVGIGSFASGGVPDERGRQQVVNGLRDAAMIWPRRSLGPGSPASRSWPLR